MIGIELSEFDLEARTTKPNKRVNSLSHLFSRSKKHGHMKMSSFQIFRPKLRCRIFFLTNKLPVN